MADDENVNDAEHSDIGISLIETIKTSDIADVALDIGEVALDSVLKDGVLKDIPVIGTIAGLAKAAVSMRDLLLAKKLLYFLRELGEIPEEKRRNFLKELENNPKEQRKIGENLILLLDRLDNLEKPIMVAKLLKAYLNGEIKKYDEFVFYSSIIDRATILELSHLLLYFSDGDVDGELLGERFYHLGLSFMMVTMNPKFRQEPENPSDAVMYRYLEEREPTNRASAKYYLSDYAYTLAKILLADRFVHRKIHPDFGSW